MLSGNELLKARLLRNDPRVGLLRWLHSSKVSKSEVWAYTLVIVAATLRVLLPFMPPHWLVPAMVVAALCWSIAFATYLLIFAPWMWRVRIDGKDG